MNFVVFRTEENNIESFSWKIIRNLLIEAFLDHR
jgi:hypothetical protein